MLIDSCQIPSCYHHFLCQVKLSSRSHLEHMLKRDHITRFGEDSLSLVMPGGGNTDYDYLGTTWLFPSLPVITKLVFRKNSIFKMWLHPHQPTPKPSWPRVPAILWKKFYSFYVLLTNFLQTKLFFAVNQYLWKCFLLEIPNLNGWHWLWVSMWKTCLILCKIGMGWTYSKHQGLYLCAQKTYFPVCIWNNEFNPSTF